MESSTKKRKLAPKPEPHSHDQIQAQSDEQHHHQQQQQQNPLPPQPQSQSQPQPPSAPSSHNQPQQKLSYSQDPPPPPPPPPRQPHYAVPDSSARHDFEAFARHLQDAAMLIQRQTERPPHADVSVLLLRWNDDQAAEKDLADLELVFQKQYGFHTQSWRIPTVANPSIKLGVQMASFLRTARPDQLFIIYYVGHGYLGSDGHLYWARDAQDDAAKLKWDGVRCLFEDAQSDIVLLLDTCSIPDPPMSGSHGAKQAIAACSSEHSLSREASGRSFTSHLVEALRRLSGGRPFSARRLYEEVCAQTQQQIDQAARAVNGGSPIDPQPAQLPVFFSLAPGKDQDLILNPASSRPPPSAASNGDDTRSPAEQIVEAESIAGLRFDEARVLVCTTFVGDASPDMSSFNQWLQNTPPLGTNIEIEGMFLGPPTMLLISMPHSIWNVVQHDKICCFLGYITSRNMVHLYEQLVGPPGVKPSAREAKDGRILLEARQLAADTTSKSQHDADGHTSVARPDYAAQENTARMAYAVAASKVTPVKSKDLGAENSAEMQEAAEQLKALSHMRHHSDETASGGTAPGGRRRTTLPDGSPTKRRRSDAATPQDINDSGAKDSLVSVDFRIRPTSRARSSKVDTQCSHCSHAPFKDSSSLRKHVAAAHTRPFPCAFSFAGCVSTFGSKNEWKRHITSQHLCLQYYRCSECPQSTAEGKVNEFNRKDLFTQHLRRMHAPYQIKRGLSKGDPQHQAEWDAHVKEMQFTCLITRRQPPQISSCPKPECQSKFEGPGSWDEWTEHVGRHMERGEADKLGVDHFLRQWAVDEGIIEPTDDKGGMRLATANGTTGLESSRPSFDHNDSITISMQDASQPDGVSTIEVTQAVDEMEVDS